MSITVTVNGQSGPSIAVKSGDQVGVTIGTSSSSYTVGVSPAGTPGGQGPAGPQGAPATTITVANTTTLAAGSNATVTATSSNNGANVSLAFGIPAGQVGPAGPAGATGPQGPAGPAGTSNLTLSSSTPSALGTAQAGSSNQAARGDHVHELPSLSTLGAAAANHAHNYVTSINGITGALTLAAGSNVSLTANGSTLTIAASGGGSFDENATVDGGVYTGQQVPSGWSGNGTAASKWTTTTNFLQAQFVAPVSGTLYIEANLTIATNGSGGFAVLQNSQLSFVRGAIQSGTYTINSGTFNKTFSAGSPLAIERRVPGEDNLWTQLDYGGVTTINSMTAWIQ